MRYKCYYAVLCACLNQQLKVCGCEGSRYFKPSFRSLLLQSRGITTCVDDSDNTTVDLLSGFRWLNCFIQIYENRTDDACTMQCQPACSERVYKSSVSVSGPWPHRAYLEQFYNSYVKNTVVERDLLSLNVMCRILSFKARVKLK